MGLKARSEGSCGMRLLLLLLLVVVVVMGQH